ncbi:TPA_asm: G [Zanthoxylum betacytorhabdovirus 3]|nr:TPA_asm: G [Zanthoxilum betacytorhabdovirus 3]
MTKKITRVETGNGAHKSLLRYGKSIFFKRCYKNGRVGVRLRNRRSGSMSREKRYLMFAETAHEGENSSDNRKRISESPQIGTRIPEIKFDNQDYDIDLESGLRLYNRLPKLTRVQISITLILILLLLVGIKKAGGAPIGETSNTEAPSRGNFEKVLFLTIVPAIKDRSNGMRTCLLIIISIIALFTIIRLVKGIVSVMIDLGVLAVEICCLIILISPVLLLKIFSRVIQLTLKIPCADEVWNRLLLKMRNLSSGIGNGSDQSDTVRYAKMIDSKIEDNHVHML